MRPHGHTKDLFKKFIVKFEIHRIDNQGNSNQEILFLDILKFCNKKTIAFEYKKFLSFQIKINDLRIKNKKIIV